MESRERAWSEAAGFVASLSDEQRERFSRYAGLDLPPDEESIARTLESYSASNPSDTPSGLLATTGAQAGFSGERDFGVEVGRAALDLAESRQDLALAHVSLAQTHFQRRREEEELALFEHHCRAAVSEGHAGTFCYERLATLYEYRGQLDEAERICRLAVEALEQEDPRSVEKFHKRLRRIEEG